MEWPLGSYFINNTLLQVGNTFITDDSSSYTIKGIIFVDWTCGSPHTTMNNIIDYRRGSPVWGRTTARYQSDSYVDYNIYTTRTGATVGTTPSFSFPKANWFESGSNHESGAHEKYLADPNWIDTTATIFAPNIGVNGCYIPDVRITEGGNANNTGKAYNLIGDTYTDAYGTHEMGKDPTGRSFAYDIFGNLRTTNDIGALGAAGGTASSGLKVIIEAPFENGKMKTNLASSNLLPLNQPYNVSPWNINDNSVITSIAANYVDWILIQLRDDSTNTRYSKAAILTDVGIVLNSDGSPFSFSSISSGQYYIVIRHRNHLDIMSAGKVQIENNVKVDYNFTDSQSKAFGPDAMANLGNGKFAMFSGDGDVNGTVNVLDYRAVADNIYFAGYAQGDLGMNGIINVLDYSFVIKNIFRKTQLP